MLMNRVSKIVASRRRILLVVAAVLAMAISAVGLRPLMAQGGGTVKVGVLQSLTGTMAISEVPVKDAEIFAIDQVNASGGVLGKKIVPIVEDGASEPAMFAQKAQKLIEDDKVVTVFGGWTSASRKAMLPVFERFHNLLWYPVQFEGNECSSNIMYSGAQPNQQILPALDWAFEKGYKKYFLLGSDYVFPRTANLILKKHILSRGGVVSGEEYVPLGGTDFSSIITKTRLAKPDIIFNTLNGDSNVSFFKQMAAAGMPPSKIPVMSFSIAEQEAKAMGAELVTDSYAAWNYFESLKNPLNKKFLAAYHAKYPNSPMDDPMVHGYIDVIVWAAAVKKANTFDPNAVRKAAAALGWENSVMGKIKFAANQSLYQTAYVGKLLPDGQFNILWQSKEPLYPQPYDPLVFPGKSCVVH
jgi:urea transport system substrate-binding protein